MCASKIVNTVPDIDSKFYAATQVVDEARHVEVYSRFLHEKLELDVSDQPAPEDAAGPDAQRRTLGLHLPGHAGAHRGFALAAFGSIRNLATDPLGAPSTPT